jgi:hypothetical protein
VRVEANVPSSMVAGTLHEVDCVMENVGWAVFVSEPPNPVHISYRWKWAATGAPVEGTEGLRTGLSRTLPPGEAYACKVKVQAPPRAGRYVLHVTLVQEHVAWFDDDAEANAAVFQMVVAPAEGGIGDSRDEDEALPAGASDAGAGRGGGHA